MSSNANRPIAVIPCKSDSRRVPWKNELTFAGVPCVLRAVNAALESEVFSDVLVSAADERIANVVREANTNAQVFVRPSFLNGDLPIRDVWAHAVESGPVRPTCLLYPNNPLVTEGMVRKSYAQFEAFARKPLTAVMRYTHPPTRAFKVNGAHRLVACNSVDYNAATDASGDFYHEAGLLSWSMSNTARQSSTIDTVAFVVTPYESWEIDHPADVLIARALLHARGY